MRMLLMCPKCGDCKYPRSGDYSREVCEYCNTKRIQLEESGDVFEKSNSDGLSLFEQRIYRKYLYNNPQFDETTFEARIKGEKDFMRGVSERVAKLPKCPTCQSTDIAPISGLERGASVLTLGLFSKKINKSFKCNKCGYTW